MLNSKTVNTVYIIVTALLLLVCVFDEEQHFRCLALFLIMTISWLTITVIGSFHIRWNYHVKAIHANKSIKENKVAITFDDGPHPEFTPKVLGLLEQYGAKATFFCIGKSIEAHPELFKEILVQGHTIGNHTYSHDHRFGFFKTPIVITELEATNLAIQQLTGVFPKLYRPAFGVTNPRIRRAVAKLKLTVIGWNIRSLDTTKRSKEQVLRRITTKVSKGDVILLHDTSQKTVEVLEQLLLFLKQQDLESVTIDSLFNIKAYA